MRVAISLVVVFLLCQVSFAQEIRNDDITPDTTFIKGDGNVIDIESYSTRFDPRKALLFSAVLPGAGQFYNKKYWKMPLVYGGFGFLIYVANFYHTLNQKYREELFGVINDGGGGYSPSGYTEDQLRTLVDRTRRERDFFIILNGLWYMLQMVDAHVDAHLKEFDLNPKMQVRLEPMFQNSMMTGKNTGISLIIRF